MRKGAIEALVDNVLRLMAARGDTQTTVADRGGISQRAVGYLATYGKTHHTSPTLRTIEGVAKAFEVPAWLLLIPDLPVELLRNRALPDLVSRYAEADEDGRGALERLATVLVRYHPPAGARSAAG